MVRLLVSKVTARSSARCLPLPCSSSTIAKRRSVRFICSLSFVEGLVGQAVGEVVLGAFDMGEGDGGKFGREVAGPVLGGEALGLAGLVAAPPPGVHRVAVPVYAARFRGVTGARFLSRGGRPGRRPVVVETGP